MFYVCYVQHNSIGAMKECDTWYNAKKMAIKMIQDNNPRLDMVEVEDSIDLEAGYFEDDWSVQIVTPD